MQPELEKMLNLAGWAITKENKTVNVINNMSIRANKNEVLEALRKNREEHFKIVVEAREAYYKESLEKLRALVSQFESMPPKSPKALGFNYSPPEDHSRVYDTAIKMLEMEIGDEVTLDSSQVQCLVMDRWDWQDRFLAGTAGYSQTAQGKMGRF